MFLGYTAGVFACLGFLCLCGAHQVTTIVEDGIPEFLNYTNGEFVKIGSGYYFMEKGIQKNWYDSYESCRRMGAALVSFETIEEWDLVNTYLRDNKIELFYWTSGNDLAKEGKHVWFATGNAVSLDIWYPKKPNRKGQCDEMGWREDKLRGNFNGFNNAPCNWPKYYICEAPQPTTASFIIW